MQLIKWISLNSTHLNKIISDFRWMITSYISFYVWLVKLLNWSTSFLDGTETEGRIIIIIIYIIQKKKKKTRTAINIFKVSFDGGVYIKAAWLMSWKGRINYEVSEWKKMVWMLSLHI